jgi:hypothetical protein
MGSHGEMIRGGWERESIADEGGVVLFVKGGGGVASG